MTCPIHWHDRCACYNASLQYTTSITTTTASSQFSPQAGNIFVGYELATPLVATSGAWHPVESVIIQPPGSYSGHETLQPDCYRLPNTYETLPLQNGYRREAYVPEQEQKPAPLSREQVRFLTPNVPSRAYTKSARDAPPVPHTIHPRRYSSSHAQQLLGIIGTAASYSPK